MRFLRSFSFGAEKSSVSLFHTICNKLNISIGNSLVSSLAPEVIIFNISDGSSIFTTGGHHNPTLSIVQFSLRLAAHLAN